MSFDNETLGNLILVLEVEDLEVLISWVRLADDFGRISNLSDGDKPPFQQMTFILADEQ